MNLLSEPTYGRPVTTRFRWLLACTVLVAACTRDKPTIAAPDQCTNLRLPVDRLLLTPSTATLRAGDTVRLTVSTPPCSTITQVENILWRVTDTNVVSVDPTGLVRAKGSGSTTVVVTPAPDSLTIMKGAAAVTVSP